MKMAVNAMLVSCALVLSASTSALAADGVESSIIGKWNRDSSVNLTFSGALARQISSFISKQPCPEEDEKVSSTLRCYKMDEESNDSLVCKVGAFSEGQFLDLIFRDMGIGRVQGEGTLVDSPRSTAEMPLKRIVLSGAPAERILEMLLTIGKFKETGSGRLGLAVHAPQIECRHRYFQEKDGIVCSFDIDEVGKVQSLQAQKNP